MQVPLCCNMAQTNPYFLTVLSIFKHLNEPDMNNTLIIDSDLEVTIKRIRQTHTYEGLLEGLPTTRMNSQILSEVMEETKRFCGLTEMHLVEPVQTEIPFEGKYPFGSPAALPGIICIAQLHCYDTFKNSKKNYSALGLAWFQKDFAFPIDQEILDKIKDIPFRKLCGEFEY